MASKRHFSITTTVFLWITALLFPAPAESQWRPTRHFTVREGLVQSQVSGITQDADGYIWVATQGGLCRFDGQSFRRLTRVDGLPDNVVNAVASRGSDVWIATDLAGVALWNGKSVEPVPDVPQMDEQQLRGILELDNGLVLVGSNTGLLAYENGSWTRLDDQPVRSLHPGKDGSALAVGSRLLRIDQDLVITIVMEAEEDRRLIASTENSDNTWMAFHPHDLVLTHDGTTQMVGADIEGQIITLLADESGTGLWIGTDQGLWRRHENGEIEEIPVWPDRQRLEVSALLRDREDNLWVGSWGSGLFQIPPSPWTLFTRETGYPAYSAWAFSEDQDGCVWMATTDAGVVSWCGDHWGPTLGLDDGLPSETVYTLALDTAGSLWIGTIEGVCRNDRAGLRCWDDTSGLKNDFIRHLVPRKSGGMWMATDQGLAMWDEAQWRFWGPEEGLPGQMVRAMAEDDSGRLWLVVDSVGISSFDGDSFELLDESDGLPTDRVWTLSLSSRGEILVGTDSGLWIRGTDDDGSGKVVGVDDGLPNGSVIAVSQDLNGRIWAGTTHGVSVISPDGKVLRTFTAREGLSDTEAAEGAAWRDSQGRLWLGTAYGITVVDPSRLSRNLVAPEVILENALSNGKTHPDFHPISTTHEGDTLSMRIDASTTHLRFNYAAPSFVAPELVRFRVALTCFGQEFSLPTTDRHVTYHALPAGKYRFGIQAVNNDGVPSEKPLWVDLDVRPPWYRTRLVQFLAIVAAALLGAGLLQLRHRGRLARKAWLEEEVKQRTSELDTANRQIQEQNRQLKELSRTDPLTGLGNRRALSEILPVEMSILKREIYRLGPGDDISQYHAAVIMMIDLDHFKAINDRWGHDVGDQALALCGKILSDEMRECDQAVRWGGEEFVILARGMTREGALVLAQRILDRINRCSLKSTEGTEIFIRASVGFLQFPLGTTDFQSSSQWPRLIDVADRLMYLAKERGRARAVGLVWRHCGFPEVSARQTCESLIADLGDLPEGMELVEFEPNGDH